MIMITKVILMLTLYFLAVLEKTKILQEIEINEDSARLVAKYRMSYSPLRIFFLFFELYSGCVACVVISKNI